MERTQEEAEDRSAFARVPRPVPGGSYRVQSLGWVDRLMGQRRIDREAAAMLEPLLISAIDMDPDPEPLEIPDPVPDGTEPVRRGEDPPGETR